MNEIIQLRIFLVDSKPPIWRQFLVHQDASFSELHKIIQIIMGWKNYHLYEFNIEGYRIGVLDENETGYGSDRLLDSNAVTLKDVIANQDSFEYLYDFGNNWKHQIEIENFLKIDPTIIYPICIDGRLNCPPEDCGGIHFFYHCMDVLKDKKSQEHKQIVEWFPKNFDEEKFEKEKINRRLKTVRRPKSNKKNAR